MMVDKIVELIKTDPESFYETTLIAQGLKYESPETREAFREWFLNRFVYSVLRKENNQERILIGIIKNALYQIDWKQLKDKFQYE